MRRVRFSFIRPLSLLETVRATGFLWQADAKHAKTSMLKKGELGEFT